MPTDKLALYWSIASGVMIAAALIVPAVYRGSHRHHQTIELKVDNFFEKYDRNGDGKVDRQEYRLVKSLEYIR